jgi:hypothetical protein
MVETEADAFPFTIEQYKKYNEHKLKGESNIFYSMMVKYAKYINDNVFVYFQKIFSEDLKFYLLGLIVLVIVFASIVFKSYVLSIFDKIKDFVYIVKQILLTFLNVVMNALPDGRSYLTSINNVLNMSDSFIDTLKIYILIVLTQNCCKEDEDRIQENAVKNKENKIDTLIKKIKTKETNGDSSVLCSLVFKTTEGVSVIIDNMQWLFTRLINQIQQYKLLTSIKELGEALYKRELEQVMKILRTQDIEKVGTYVKKDKDNRYTTSNASMLMPKWMSQSLPTVPFLINENSLQLNVNPGLLREYLIPAEKVSFDENKWKYQISLFLLFGFILLNMKKIKYVYVFLKKVFKWSSFFIVTKNLQN